jgi:hypothetical protein
VSYFLEKLPGVVTKLRSLTKAGARV